MCGQENGPEEEELNLTELSIIREKDLFVVRTLLLAGLWTFYVPDALDYHGNTVILRKKKSV